MRQLRSIAQFVNRHPSLTAKQTRFLGLLTNHIARYGSITIEKLYDQPLPKLILMDLMVFLKPNRLG